jgi:3-oxoacyl-[acyl-carrier protein] reductase
MKIDFSDMTILVTGATRGIGKQIADDLHDAGATLFLTGTKDEEIDYLNKESERNGGRKKYFCVNVADTYSIDKFLAEIRNLERIDGLVNNAGINRLNYIDDAIDQDWHDMIAVNLTAPF